VITAGTLLLRLEKLHIFGWNLEGALGEEQDVSFFQLSAAPASAVFRRPSFRGERAR
jgi:hypothetical protein